MVFILNEDFEQKEEKAVKKIVTPASFFHKHYLRIFRSMKHQCEDFLEG